MPTADTLLAFALAACVLIVIPGPNAIYIVARGVEHGRPLAVASALGIETGSLVHIAAAAIGLSAALAASDLAFDVVRYAGAAYLVYLAVRTLRRAPAGAVEGGGTARRWDAYRQAVLVNALNPKVALFFLAFLPQFVDRDRGAASTQVLVLGAVFVLVGLCVDLVYATAAGALGHRLRAHARAQQLACAAVYLALGAFAALS